MKGWAVPSDLVTHVVLLLLETGGTPGMRKEPDCDYDKRNISVVISNS
jgi:hypothetical protein